MGLIGDMLAMADLDAACAPVCGRRAATRLISTCAADESASQGAASNSGLEATGLWDLPLLFVGKREGGQSTVKSRDKGESCAGQVGKEARRQLRPGRTGDTVKGSQVAPRVVAASLSRSPGTLATLSIPIRPFSYTTSNTD